MKRTIPTFYEDFACGDTLYSSETAYTFFQCPFNGRNVIDHVAPKELLAYFDNLDSQVTYVSKKHQKLYDEFKKLEDNEYYGDSDFIAFLIDNIPASKKLFMLHISHPEGVGGDFAELLYEGEYHQIWMPIYEEDLEEPDEIESFYELYEQGEIRKVTKAKLLQKLKKKESLVGLNLIGMNLEGMDLSGTDLSGSYLRYAKLANVIFSNADLSGVDFSCADLSGANFEGATLEYNQFQCAKMCHMNLSGTSFEGRKLSGVDFSNANLRNVDFSNANLENVNLSNADLTGAKLIDADLSNANLVGAIMDDTEKKGTCFDGAVFE